MDEKNKKIIFIPGWLHSIRFYGKDRGVEIWTKNFGMKKKIDADIIIGHSLGANFALVNFFHNRNFEKIILVNPVLGKNNLWRMLTDWMKHALAEGAEPDKLEVLLKNSMLEY